MLAARRRPRASRMALVAIVIASVIAVSGKPASAAPTISPTPSVNGTVYAFTQIGTTLYIGGSFTRVGGQTVNDLAAIDTTTGAVISAWKPITDGVVYALATD